MAAPGGVGLPDQIPPQGSPFVYQDGEGNYRLEIDWWLFLYFVGTQVASLQDGGSALPNAVNIPMIDLDSVASDVEQVRLLAQKAWVLANDAALQDPSLGGGGSGTVTHTAGPLTAFATVVGNGGADIYTPSGVGTSGQVWTSAGPGVAPAFQTAAGLTNPMTTAGDIIVGGASGAPARLGIGANGNVLTVVSGAEAWAPPSGGGVSLSTVNVFTKNQSVSPSTLTDASTVAIDASLSNNFRLLTTAAIGATRIIGAPTNLTDGMWLTVYIKQSSTGSNAATWNAIWTFPGSVTPGLSTGNNLVDIVTGYYDATDAKIRATIAPAYT